MESFVDRLAARVEQCGNPVLVGLDPRFEQLPEELRQGRDAKDLSRRLKVRGSLGWVAEGFFEFQFCYAKDLRCGS